jgi:hypothetical protein
MVLGVILMNLSEYIDYSTAIVNTIAILGVLLSAKAIFKWVLPKLKTKRQIDKLLIERGCKKCPRNQDIDYLNGGFCHWQNPASFGRTDLTDCKCFNK